MTFEMNRCCVRFPSLLTALAASVLLSVTPQIVSAQSLLAANRMSISAYKIDAELDTTAHHLTATAVVTFTAPETADEVTFGFHPALKLTKVTDDAGKLLTGERTADGSIRIAPATPFVKGQPAHWTFAYEGTISGSEDGPVEGLKLAAIQEPVTYLLYPARWFPTVGYLTDRFTAELHIRVPQGLRVLASGAQGGPATVTLANGKRVSSTTSTGPSRGFQGR